MSETLELFNNLLQLAVDNGASDVHIKTNKPALLRIDGHLEPIDMDSITVNQILAFVDDSCPPQFRSTIVIVSRTSAVSVSTPSTSAGPRAWSSVTSRTSRRVSSS